MTVVSVFDTETTGLKVEKGHRIIEVAIAMYEVETERKLFEFVKRVNPGVAIDPKAQMIHGISQRDLIGKQQFKDIEPVITRFFEKSDIAVAHNIGFDIEFLFNEYSLIGKRIPDVQGFDTMEQGRWATSNGKLPNLGELCYACEVDYDPDQAHQALYDITKTAECFFFGIKHGGYNIKEFIK